ncbi:hypothetical protein ACIA8C_42785 [Nocardia sp. NPDC051321]|uniref:hypothetical protein n=1 Tax=Nocardia sp. NPDC051321 TaxID=3364323 RepID=UPI0037A9DA06
MSAWDAILEHRSHVAGRSWFRVCVDYRADDAPDDLTAVAEEYGTEQASRQGGHAVISTGADITDRYLDRPRQAPDSTAALDKLR